MADLTLTRRALVAGAGVSALAGFPAMAAPHTDAALLDLGRRFDLAAARADAASDAVDEAWDAYVAPEPPEALFHRPSDTFSVYGTTKRDGRRWYGDEIDSMRRLACCTPVQMPDLSFIIVSQDREAARRDEIVAAYDGWQADMVAARDAAGLTAAEAERAAASAELRALMSAIAATPATTLDGVLVKARVAGWGHGGLDGLSEEIEDEQAGTADVVMLDLLRDLLRIGGPGGIPAA